jgi:putative ABC transport system ATP-binding protein
LFDKLHREGNTIVLVTHDAEVAMHAKRFIRLRDGKVEEDSMNQRTSAETPGTPHAPQIQN